MLLVVETRVEDAIIFHHVKSITCQIDVQNSIEGDIKTANKVPKNVDYTPKFPAETKVSAALSTLLRNHKG